MIIKDIMQTRVVSVGMDQRLFDIKDIFDNVSFHHLVVLDDEDKVVGVLTEADVLAALSPFLGKAAESQRDIQTLTQRVHQLMSRDPQCCLSATSISDAGSIMVEQGLSCLPVVDSDKQLLGIVTWKDVLAFLLVSSKNG
ncbi:CBS domain-containing protein [Agarivorans sp. MS3-6]|uniref:CBS domain-containing protein n=1 Tax=Agarivorans sp. TSD2052 TaxID=2937286 RepID=UPI00200BDADD|nr:CBS domain-containing protein [Agarivorans sp. TSD2052]UPW20642.1 CBS domain-containing protein [Agarivorans sp. TSD2052]